MKKEDFEDLYKKFSGTFRSFTEDEWDEAISRWNQYCDLIKNGLPIDRWLRNTEKGYLPDFLDTKEQRFGHARIGNYEQVMIYQYTGTDEARNNN